MQAIIEINKNKLIEICKEFKIKRLYVFGSVVGDDFTDNSDIDFLLSFFDNLTPEQYADNYIELHYRLRKLFFREIDILTERTLKNPYFVDQVNKSKQLIYEA